MDFKVVQMDSQISEWMAMLVDYSLDLAGAVLLLAAGWWLARAVKRRLLSVLHGSRRIDNTIAPIIATAVSYVILAIVVVMVLGQFGVQTASIVAALGAIGLAVGLALQGTLSNIAAGFMLLFLRPFKVGDYIDAEGLAGNVREINFFTTELETFDGVYISAPNNKIWNASIKNFSRLPYRRVDVAVGVSYNDDVAAAMAVLQTLLEADARTLTTHGKEPQVMVSGLGASSVDLNLRCWVNRADYWAMLFDLQKNAKLELDKHGFEIPFPQRDVHVYQHVVDDMAKADEKPLKKEKK